MLIETSYVTARLHNKKNICKYFLYLLWISNPIFKSKKNPISFDIQFIKGMAPWLAMTALQTWNLKCCYANGRYCYGIFYILHIFTQIQLIVRKVPTRKQKGNLSLSSYKAVIYLECAPLWEKERGSEGYLHRSVHMFPCLFCPG